MICSSHVNASREENTISYLNVLVGLVGNIFLTAPDALEPAVDLAMSCVICPIVLVSWRPWSSSDEVCCCINASRSITGCAPGIESRTEKVKFERLNQYSLRSKHGCLPSSNLQ